MFIKECYPGKLTIKYYGKTKFIQRQFGWVHLKNPLYPFTFCSGGTPF